MKIAAVIDNDISAGGGFNQALNAILLMDKICKNKYEFTIYTTKAENVSYLNQLGIDSQVYKVSILDKFLALGIQSLFFRKMQDKLKIIGGFERMLESAKVDLVYFVTPTTDCLRLQRLNYILTVWDLCHLDYPEFPEVREYGEFLSREHGYKNSLPQAYLVIVDSEALSKKIALNYGVNEDKIVSIPFSPSPLLQSAGSLTKEEVLKKYSLKEGYYFYPAQFWAHKNHLRILEALSSLKSQDHDLQAVFCGKDYGTLDYIKTEINRLALTENVRILGFVPSEDIAGLYIGASAVVMPTYFGLTNIPPLEAWSYAKPLIYSRHLQEQGGNAALYVDPDSCEDLVNAMILVLDPKNCKDLIANGVTRLKDLDEERSIGIETLESKLKLFSKRVGCFKKKPK